MSLLALLAFMALFGWGEYANWRSQVERIDESLEQAAEAMAQHADDVIEMSHLPLASLISEINDEARHPEMPVKIKALIRRQMKASPTLNTLSFVDAEGRMVATSSEAAPVGMSYADRDYFQFHKSNPLRLPVVGKPILSRLSHAWVIPITQRVTLADGTFAGVVMSTIKVNHFINFFRKFDVGRDPAFLMVRGDGIVLARGPLREDLFGTNISEHELFTRYLMNQRIGAYHAKSSVDGLDRAGGFYQSERTGIVVLVSTTEWGIFKNWVETAEMRWAYAGVLLGVVLVAAALWERHMRLRRRSEALQAAREAEFRLLAESSSDVISRFNEDGVREYVSPSSTEILGLEPQSLIGKSVYAGLDSEAEARVKAAVENLKAGSLLEKFVIRHLKPNGEEVWLETGLSKVPASSGHQRIRIVAITRDVSRHKKKQDELDALAHTDELTGLSNRRSFNLRFEELAEQASRTATPLSLLMLDVDRFKLYNDTYGHAAGDDCLRQIGAVVRENVLHPADVAARYGGEELAIVLSDTDAVQAAVVAERIRARVEALGLQHVGNPPTKRVTLSIGATTCVPEASSSTTCQSLLLEADKALYVAKSSGRNKCISASQSSDRRRAKAARSA